MKTTLLEIIELSRQNSLDPVAEIKDYFEEKDSHITWQEAEQLVSRLTQRLSTHETTTAPRSS